jgi:hypothetical protein
MKITKRKFFSVAFMATIGVVLGKPHVKPPITVGFLDAAYSRNFLTRGKIDWIRNGTIRDGGFRFGYRSLVVIKKNFKIPVDSFPVQD